MLASGLLCVIAWSRGTKVSSASRTVSCRKILPSALTVTTSGSLFSLIAGACAFGRSTGTPTVRSGAATMKTMSNTSMTSTSGVPAAAVAMPPAAADQSRRHRSGLLIELARQDRAELAGERFEPPGVASEIGRQFVVGDDRGDRRDETERRR